MKKAFWGIVVFVLFAGTGPAMAADAQSPSSDSKTYNWTGFYVGLNGGYGWGDTDWSYQPSAPGPQPNHTINGGVIGGTAGANLQLLSSPGGIPALVGGIEADFDWADMGGGTACPNGDFRCKSNIEEISTLRGRIGLAFDRFFIFGTAGLAVGNVNVETVNTAGNSPPSGTPTNGENSWRTGFAVGVGGEYALCNKMSLKLEYLHYDLGSHNYSVDFSTQVRAGERGDLARAGLNYKF